MSPFPNLGVNLGHIVSADRVGTDPEEVKAVKEWREPKDLKDLSSFLGLCSCYCRFIPQLSSVAKPLTKLTERGKSLEGAQYKLKHGQS